MASRSRRRLPERNIESWREFAKCRPSNGHDPRLWFPREPQEWSTRAEYQQQKRIRDHITEEARAICMACPVRGDCLDYAFAMDETEGIWGGLTPEERGIIPLR